MTQTSPCVTTPVEQKDKYAALRERFPTFNHPELYTNRVKSDKSLLSALIDRFDEIDPYRRRYAASFINAQGKPDYKTFPHRWDFQKNPWKVRLDRNILEQHFRGDNLALAIDFTDPRQFKMKMTGRNDADTRFLMLDLDIPDFDVCEKVAIRIKHILQDDLGIPCHLSYSGSKGVHVEVYLDHKVSSIVCDNFRSYVLEQYSISDMYAPLVETYRAMNTQVDIEVRPQKTAGNAAKFALGINYKSSMFCGYLQEQNGKLVEVPDSYKYFLDIKQNAPATTLESISEKWETMQRQKRNERNARKGRSTSHGQTSPSVRKSARPDTSALMKALHDRYGFGGDEIDLKTPDGTRLKVQFILERGLLPGFKRHDTTMLLLRYLRFDHTKNQAFRIVEKWSKEVLYKHCGDQIGTDLWDHLSWVSSAIENLWAQPPKPLETLLTITKSEFQQLVGFTTKPIKNGQTIDLSLLRVLLGLYLYSLSYTPQRFQDSSGLQEAARQEGNTKGWFGVSYQYLSWRTGCSMVTIHKSIQRLKELGVLQVRRRRECHDNLWQVWINRYRFRLDLNPDGDSYSLDLVDVRNPNLAEILLCHFFEKKELRQLLGGRGNQRKVNRVLAFKA